MSRSLIYALYVARTKFYISIAISYYVILYDIIIVYYIIVLLKFYIDFIPKNPNTVKCFTLI